MSWQSLGGGFNTGPAACSWGPGRLDVFGRGEDFALWHDWYDGDGWHEWESLGGGLTSRPAAVSRWPGHVEAFVRGEDNALWHRWYDDGWSDWESLGGGLTGGPGACSWGARSHGRLRAGPRGRADAPRLRPRLARTGSRSTRTRPG